MIIGKFCLKNKTETRVKKPRQNFQKIIDEKNHKTSSYIESSFSTEFISQPNPPGVIFSTPISFTSSISDIHKGCDDFEKNNYFETKRVNDNIFSYCVLLKSYNGEYSVKPLNADEKFWG